MATTINQTYVGYDVTQQITNKDFGVRVRLELRVNFTQYPEENRTIITEANLFTIVDVDPKPDGGVESIIIDTGRWGLTYPITIQQDGGYSYYVEGSSNNINNVYIQTGTSKEICLASVTKNMSLAHFLDGSINDLLFTHDFRGLWVNENDSSKTIFYFNTLPTMPSNGSLYYHRFKLPNIDRAVYPTTANNFTDMENPAFNYTPPSTGDYGLGNYVQAEVSVSGGTLWMTASDTIVSLQAAISFNGTTPDIAYRDIPIDGTYYAFNLTEAEREVLRKKANTAINTPIYYLIKIVRGVSRTDAITPNASIVSKTQRVLTIVGCNPTLNPTVKDIKPETLALTGNENTVVRYESMVEYAINATASKHATIVSQSVQCGSKTVSGLPQGIIDDVESGLFVFKATDSRNLSIEKSIQKNIIDYVKPTCYQKLETGLKGETGAEIILTISGNYFNSSFGAASNELKLEVRHTQNDGTMGDWVTLTDGLIPVFNGNTYELEVTISGFSYSQAYTFQCRATDKLNVVTSSQYTTRVLPVFDWGDKDFNFNVPVNIQAENLDMHGETILRHGETTNNTVLSGSGGHIYLRPGGTNNTSGEVRITAQGNIEIKGDIIINGVSLTNILKQGGLM